MLSTIFNHYTIPKLNNILCDGPRVVMWAQPRHLTTPGLATWRSPGGDQKILKWGGERVASYISHPEVIGFFNQ